MHFFIFIGRTSQSHNQILKSIIHHMLRLNEYSNSHFNVINKQGGNFYIKNETESCGACQNIIFAF